MIAVPQRLRQRIELHVFRNLAADALGPSPLILGIEGSPGMGKTRAVEEVARGADIRVFLISGGQLESPHAGQPAQLVRSTYRQAGESIKNGARGALVIVNDVDVALGHWGTSVQYTMNRQMVIGEFMHLCDFPTEIEGVDTPRVPIIFTGNNLSTIHGPLVRPGRFDYFSWSPTHEEKLQVVTSMLPPELGRTAVALTTAYPDESIAFFSDAIAAATSTAIGSMLAKHGLREALRAIQLGQRPIPPVLSGDQVLAQAALIRAARTGREGVA